MPGKRRRSPQEKKILSYQKDRRSAYGENHKASRKAIPLFKARGNRAVRRQEHMALRVSSEDAADLDLTRVQLKMKKRRRKWPDWNLAEFLDVEVHARSGLGKRRQDRKALRAEALRRLRRSGSPYDHWWRLWT